MYPDYTEQYKRIVETLKRISNDIDSFNNDIYMLQNSLKKSIIINDKVYCYDNFSKIRNNGLDICNTINDNIIPSLNGKING